MNFFLSHEDREQKVRRVCGCQILQHDKIISKKIVITYSSHLDSTHPSPSRFFCRPGWEHHGKDWLCCDTVLRAVWRRRGRGWIYRWDGRRILVSNTNYPVFVEKDYNRQCLCCDDAWTHVKRDTEGWRWAVLLFSHNLPAWDSEGAPLFGHTNRYCPLPPSSKPG
jgi:hypothetical protein